MDRPEKNVEFFYREEKVRPLRAVDEIGEFGVDCRKAVLLEKSMDQKELVVKIVCPHGTPSLCCFALLIGNDSIFVLYKT